MLERVKPFSERFQEALDNNNMKPAELSRKTGISESTISQYRSGYAEPKKKRLSIIADALNVDPSWLMGLSVPMRKQVSANGINLSDLEIKLITNYRSADEQTRRIIKYALNLEEMEK